MKKIVTLFTIALMFVCAISKAQTTAMDFNRADCNGNNQHLFAQLDSNHVAVIEFFMNNCNSCIVAANKMKPMYNALNAQYAGKMHSYSIGYNNTYICTTIKNWVNTNNPISIPMDSGAAQVAYYGGFGMPTVVVVAGTDHKVLFSTIGFTTSDTTAMGIAIRNFFATSAINLPENVTDFKVFPNPATSNFSVELTVNEATTISFELTNLAGQAVRSTSSEKISAGVYTQNISTSDLAEGMYILKATVNGMTTSRKLSVIR